MAKTKKKQIAKLSAALLSASKRSGSVNPTCRISKSKFMAGLQCPKREYLQVHRPELAESGRDAWPVSRAGPLALPPSPLTIESTLAAEREADHFASHLLMPTEPFRKLARGHKPGLSGVLAIAEHFEASVTRGLLR